MVYLTTPMPTDNVTATSSTSATDADGGAVTSVSPAPLASVLELFDRHTLDGSECARYSRHSIAAYLRTKSNGPKTASFWKDFAFHAQSALSVALKQLLGPRFWAAHLNRGDDDLFDNDWHANLFLSRNSETEFHLDGSFFAGVLHIDGSKSWTLGHAGSVSNCVSRKFPFNARRNDIDNLIPTFDAETILQGRFRCNQVTLNAGSLLFFRPLVPHAVVSIGSDLCVHLLASFRVGARHIVPSVLDHPLRLMEDTQTYGIAAAAAGEEDLAPTYRLVRLGRPSRGPPAAVHGHMWQKSHNNNHYLCKICGTRFRHGMTKKCV